MVTTKQATLPASGSESLWRDAPRVPGALPGLGHLREVMRNPVKLAHFAYRSCGEVAEIVLPFKRLFLFTGPEAHDFVLNSPADALSMSDFFKFILPAFFGPTFKHDPKLDFPYAYVRLYHPLMTEAKLKRHAATMDREIAQTLAAIEGEIDLYDLGKLLMLRAAGRSILGEGIDAAQFAEFERFYMNMYGALGLPAIASANLGLPFATKAEKARRRLYEILGAALARRRQAAQADDSLLDILLAAQHPEGRPLTDDEISGMTLQLLFAAHTPASVTFAWAGVEMSLNPAWTARVRQQVEEQSLDASRPPVAFARSLTYLDWTMQETLRLHSPAAFHARSVLRDVEYKGYRIPKGSVAMIAPDVAHRLAKYFPEPDAFDPTRFSPDRSERKGHPLAVMTFGAGPRRCIGSAFALMQLNLAWAHVLRRFDVELLDDVSPKYSGLMMTPSRCRARLTRRLP